MTITNSLVYDGVLPGMIAIPATTRLFTHAAYPGFIFKKVASKGELMACNGIIGQLKWKGSAQPGALIYGVGADRDYIANGGPIKCPADSSPARYAKSGMGMVMGYTQTPLYDCWAFTSYLASIAELNAAVTVMGILSDADYGVGCTSGFEGSYAAWAFNTPKLHGYVGRDLYMGQMRQVLLGCSDAFKVDADPDVADVIDAALAEYVPTIPEGDQLIIPLWATFDVNGEIIYGFPGPTAKYEQKSMYSGPPYAEIAGPWSGASNYQLNEGREGRFFRWGRPTETEPFQYHTVGLHPMSGAGQWLVDHAFAMTPAKALTAGQFATPVWTGVTELKDILPLMVSVTGSAATDNINLAGAAIPADFDGIATRSTVPDTYEQLENRRIRGTLDRLAAHVTAIMDLAAAKA